jgi:hypothetical protein
MSSNVDISCEQTILETNEKVYGLIYEITNTTTNMIYVGQTLSHRKNKDKYRPFGILGRFNDHVSEAVNNTKRKQCSYLNNAIRKHGTDVFKVQLLETCVVSALNECEQHYIKERDSMYPKGYNLTKGGKTLYEHTFLDHSLLQEPKTRGGSTARSDATKEKMSQRQKELINDEFCLERSAHAKDQHHIGKIERFKDCKIDLTKIDTYIRKKGNKIVVTIDGKKAEFASKHESTEQLKERAKAFVIALSDATLSNCGKSVKHE